jgi:hypothetical protein
MKRDASSPPPDTKPAPPFKWLSLGDLPEVMPSWLIDNILPAGSLICLYGKRGQGKTFLALDWACCIATGTAWQKMAAQRGRVAYLLAERPAGLGRRLRGWMEHAKFDEAEGAGKLQEDGIKWLVFGQKRFPLDNEADRAELIKLLEAEFGQREETPKSVTAPPDPKRLSLLVMDPLVFFMDGSENETRDMQKFIDGALDLVNQIGCSILLVHHEGKGNINNILGARGSSALEAGMDTVVYLSPQGANDISEMVVTKQREAPAMKPIYLHFKEQSRTGKRRGIFPTVTPEPPIRPEPPSKRDRKAQSEAKKKAKAETGFGRAETLAAIQALESAKKVVTITEILMSIPEDKRPDRQKLRKLMIAMREAKELFLIEKRPSQKGDIYSTRALEDHVATAPVPSQDGTSRPAEEAAPPEG